MLSDRIVYGVNSKKTKKRVELLRGNELTLIKALSICRVDERLTTGRKGRSVPSNVIKTNNL